MKHVSKTPHIRGYDKFIDVDKRGAEERFHDFEIQLSRALLRLDGKRVDALMMLGHSFTHKGLYKQVLVVDCKLVALRPDDPIIFYNLACSLSNLGELDESLDAIKKSLDLGYRDIPYMLADPDLENVRQDPRFKRLLDRKWGKRTRD